MAAIPVNPTRFNDEFGDFAVSPVGPVLCEESSQTHESDIVSVRLHQVLDAFLVYGKPKAVTEDIEHRQRNFIWICLAVQLLATAVVCFTSYQVCACLEIGGCGAVEHQMTPFLQSMTVTLYTCAVSTPWADLCLLPNDSP